MLAERGLLADFSSYDITKRVEAGPHAGTIFEIIHVEKDQPPVVTYRHEGIADHDSYAWGLPLAPVRQVGTRDTASLAVADASR